MTPEQLGLDLILTMMLATVTALFMALRRMNRRINMIEGRMEVLALASLLGLQTDDNPLETAFKKSVKNKSREQIKKLGRPQGSKNTSKKVK